MLRPKNYALGLVSHISADGRASAELTISSEHLEYLMHLPYVGLISPNLFIRDNYLVVFDARYDPYAARNELAREIDTLFTDAPLSDEWGKWTPPEDLIEYE